MTDSLLFRGRALIDGKVQNAAVRVEAGRIAAVSKGDLGQADHDVELSPRQTLMPAGVDTLCAMRDGPEAERDTVETVTRAALSAGVTTVCDQANTVPRINTTELARERAAYVSERAHSDFTINAHPPADAADLRGYAEAGVFSLQAFPWDMAAWNTPRDTDRSAREYKHYADLGFEVLFFPDELALRDTPWREHGENYALGALLRRLPPDLNARILVTRGDSVERILAARDSLPKVRIAVAPHSLFISKEEGFRRIGLGATQVPPLRSQADVDALRAYAEAGDIDIVCSHHAPHRMGDKYSEHPIEGEFTPKAGYSAADIAYPLLMTKLGLAAAARLMSENPARHLGLRKGRIARGFDADFAIVEEAEDILDKGIHEHGGVTAGVWKIDPARFQSKGHVTPFVGERLRHRVVRTFLRGAEVYEASETRFRRTNVVQIKRS